MRIIRLSASILAIAGLMGTNAAPMLSDNTGRQMPTELHRARDDTYLDTTRTRPTESGRLNARVLAQNVGPDAKSMLTATKAVATLGAGMGGGVPTGSGSKWAVVMVQNMQANPAGNTTAVTDMNSRMHNFGGGNVVVGITMWSLGREDGWVVGVTVAIALIAVLLCCSMSLWCLRRMRETFEIAVERVQKGHAGVSSPSLPVKPGERWTMPLSPLPRAASEDGYSPVHRSGTTPACSWHTPSSVMSTCGIRTSEILAPGGGRILIQ